MSYEALSICIFSVWSCHDTPICKRLRIVIRDFSFPNLSAFGLFLLLILDQLDVRFRHLVSMHL